MKWGLWSSVPANNSNTPPDGWPEGQAPSTVNDCAREMMAQVKVGIKDIQYIDLGVTPTRTSGNTFTMVGDQTQWYGYGNRVRCTDGASTLYGTVISSTFTTVTGVTLRLDIPDSLGPLLTASFSAVASGFPAALNSGLPEAGYRAKNFFDNPLPTVWQRGDGPFAIAGGNVGMYFADRWMIQSNTTATFAGNVTRLASVPNVRQVGKLINGSIGISVSAAQSVVNAGNYFGLVQKMEGYDWAEIAQKPTTISFAAFCDETGTYCVALRNSGNNQCCVQNYVISQASSWEKKTITFPKSPAAGTWDYSTGTGVEVWFTFAAGSTFQTATAGAWTATNAIASGSIGNFMRSAGTTLALCDFSFVEGSQLLPTEQRKYKDEIEKCRRYLQPQAGRAFGHAFTTSGAIYDFPLSPVMRGGVSFSAVASTLIIATNGAATPVSVSSVVAIVIQPHRGILQANVVGTPLTAGQGSMLYQTATIVTWVTFKSEL